MLSRIGRRGLLTAAVAAAAAGAVRPARAAAAQRLKFDELYAGIGIFGVQLSDRARQLEGQAVTIRGFMAPPLRADARFMVLTREPVSLCPFCQSDAEWPVDIVVVYLADRLDDYDAGHPVNATGRFELGSKTDETTGFVSLVRLVDASLR